MDMTVSTAKTFPRDVRPFKPKLMNLATMDLETAESCYYTLERMEADGRKKLIIGPSIRLIEMAAAVWGNLRSGARFVSDSGDFIVTEGASHDLEANVYWTAQNIRRITRRDGSRYNTDMIAITANASMSIAARNAVLRHLPRPTIDGVIDACQRMVSRNPGDLAERVRKMVGYFERQGITPDRVLAKLDRPNIEAVTADDLALLKGFITWVKDAQSTWDEVFPRDEGHGQPAPTTGQQPTADTGEDAKRAATKPTAQPPKTEPGKPTTAPGKSGPPAEAQTVLLPPPTPTNDQPGKAPRRRAVREATPQNTTALPPTAPVTEGDITPPQLIELRKTIAAITPPVTERQVAVVLWELGIVEADTAPANLDSLSDADAGLALANFDSLIEQARAVK